MDSTNQVDIAAATSNLQAILRETFRDQNDRDRAAEYALSILFLKYVSDHPRFTVPLFASFDQLYGQRHEDDFGDLIDAACYSLEESNAPRLGGIFTEFKFGKRSSFANIRGWNRYISELFTCFHRIRTSVIDERLTESHQVFSAVADRIAFGPSRKGGDSFTPPRIAELLAKLARPNPGDSVYDPACGLGTILVAAAREMESRIGAACGQELNSRALALARMNMLIHDLDNAQLVLGDSLREPRFIEHDRLMRFDVVVSNPPYSMHRWGFDAAEGDVFQRFKWGIPPRGNGDWAFLSHVAESTKDQGRAVVVISHGALFRGGVEGGIRRAFIDDNLIDAVIALPSNLLPSVSVPIALLVLDKARTKKGRRDVFVCDASRQYVLNKSRKSITHEHVEQIVRAYRSFEGADPWSEIELQYCRRVSYAELANHDFDLSIGKYINTEADVKHGEQLDAEIRAIESELAAIRAELLNYSDLLE